MKTRKIVSFKQTCPTVDFSFELVTTDNSYFPNILIMTVLGSYRDGSTGDDDAKLIKGTMDMAVDIWRPLAVLLDLSEFQYDWGDSIVLFLDGPDPQRPIAIVVGPKCRQAMSTLKFGLHTTKDIVDNVEVFDDKEKAIAHLERKENGS
jgi:hypothetical protein